MRRLLTPSWLVLHFLAVVLTTGFVLLGWWQLGRAQGGSAISWGYAFEWPLFAVFTIALWIRQMRLELHKDRPERSRRRNEPPPMTSPFEGSIMQARRNDDGSSMQARRNDEFSTQTHPSDAELSLPTGGPRTDPNQERTA